MLMALLLACPLCGGKPPDPSFPVEPVPAAPATAAPAPVEPTTAAPAPVEPAAVEAEAAAPITLPPVVPSDKPTPPCSGLEPRLWSLVTSPEPVTIVVDGSFTPPDWLTMDAFVDSIAQAAVPGTRLCELAALPGVIGVRPPMFGHPKLTP